MGMLLLSSSVHAQTKPPAKEPDYARNPVWIAMMDDTAANFYVVERAFNTYFAHHEMPGGEEEVMIEGNKPGKRLTRRQQRRLDAEAALCFEVKRYNFWHMQTLPYVRPDGSILTPSERLAIWQAGRGK